MNILIWLLTGVHVLVALVLIVLVLMQKSSDQGVGAAFGGNVTETVFGGSITPLVKMTIWCAGIMLATTLLLATLHARRGDTGERGSLVNKLQQTAPSAPAPVAPAPVAPVTPAPAPAPAPAAP